MHPILSSPRRLALYFAVWLPIAGFFGYLLTVGGMLDWPTALIFSAPLCLVYAGVCLTVWYSCRVLPLRPPGIRRALTVHVLAACAEGAIWAVLAKTIAVGLERGQRFAGIGDRLTPLLPLIFATIVLLYGLSAAGYYLLLALEASRAAEARMLHTAMLARDAELRALKAQVNPHFLFNSLNSVSALTSSDPARAREMCILLGDFLRRTLGLGERAGITLEEELALVHAFIAVEKVRFGDRIQLQEQIAPDALQSQVPPLFLQPLIENAVIHGISHLVEGGFIHLNIACAGGQLLVTVANSFDPDAPRRGNSGLGLVNVRNRLAARYDGAATLTTAATEHIFRVAIALPWETLV